MSKLVTLMYHAVYSTDLEYADISAEDRPYALHRDEFEKQVKWIASEGFNVLNPGSKFIDISDSNINILITFDDGHVGFYLYAYPILSKYNFTGIFFITTNFIGVRKEFCSWDQLNEMSKNNMSIQSHGVTHKFIENMSRAEMELEFTVSKSEIEKHTQNKVWAISFPGGRFNSESLKVGNEAEYSYYFTSESKTTKLPVQKKSKIGRFAIKRNTQVSDIQKFINPSYAQYLKSVTVSIIKFILKKLLGNYGYHKLYKAFNKTDRV